MGELYQDHLNRVIDDLNDQLAAKEKIILEQIGELVNKTMLIAALKEKCNLQEKLIALQDAAIKASEDRLSDAAWAADKNQMGCC